MAALETWLRVESLPLCAWQSLASAWLESFYNWPLLYLLGGDDELLTLGQRQFDATTKLGVELGHVFNEYEVGYDQFHQSESMIYFYLLCMADPTHPVNAERAQRFAGLFMNEDPEAHNYDPKHNILRSAHNGSKGARETVWGAYGGPGFSSGGMARYGLPYEDVPAPPNRYAIIIYIDIYIQILHANVTYVLYGAGNGS